MVKIEDIGQSKAKGKKMFVRLSDGDKVKTVHFGAKGFEDYTTHKDESRKLRYLSRHKSGEDWGKSGVYTAGFWSRWVLWNKPTITESIADVKSRFNIE